jgi:RNA polymerase subunit RPABC4/transcription elongation factor Spt4
MMRKELQFLVFTSLLLLNLFCSIVSLPVAYAKGRSMPAWFAACIFLGIIGLALLVLLPRLKPCPQCGTRIRQDAPLCYYCGYDMVEHLRHSSADEYTYCSKCQRAVDKDAKTCPVCGESLE